MVCPSISLENCDLYNDALKYTTIRKDLPIFAFDGFKTPLMKHICLLYFFSPAFASQLSKRKEERIITKF